MVRASNLVIRLGRDPTGRVSYRSRFDYNGTRYDLLLTDPEARRKLGPRIPPTTGKLVDVPVGSVRICVSLARGLQGVHYKVVATILEGL